MRKKIAIALLLLGVYQKLFTQDYIKYHSIVSSALEETLDSNYQSAMTLFNDAFNKEYKPFVRDTYIAAQVACLLKEFDLAEKYLIQSAQLGMSQIALNYPIFLEFKSTENYQNFTNDFEKHRAIYEKSINTKYRLDCIKMVYRDQEFSTKTHKFINFFWPFSSIIWHKLDKVDKTILTELDSLIELHDGALPFRSTIGVRDFEFSTMPNNKEGLNDFLLATVFWHYTFGFQEWESRLVKALKTGELSARNFALIRTFCGRYNEFAPKKTLKKLKNKDYKYYSKWGYLMPKEEEEEVNKAREKIGLFSIEYENKLHKAKREFRFQLNKSKPTKYGLINYKYNDL